ncbi:MAG TPA: hypothetical protein VMU81_14975 [Acetobacteraceae bacterium]|nr:hypothetical protein [Acetobacteraceae bacterium]
MSRSDRILDALLAKLGEKDSIQRLEALYIRRYDNLPPATVAECVQHSFYKMLKSYAGTPQSPRTLEAAERLLHTVIRNTLIDEVRRAGLMSFVELDDDYLALVGAQARIWVDGGPDNPAAARTRWQDETKATEADEAAAKDRRARRFPRPSSDDSQTLENILVEEIDTRNLIKRLFEQLDPKYRTVVMLLIEEWSPDELRSVFGQNGYKLRVWARVKVCRILASLAELGHELAERLHTHGGCFAMLLSIQGGAASSSA